MFLKIFGRSVRPLGRGARRCSAPNLFWSRLLGRDQKRISAQHLTLVLLQTKFNKTSVCTLSFNSVKPKISQTWSTVALR